MAYSKYMTVLMASNYSLNIRGDDPGSSRTFDAIAAGVVQIVVSDRFLSEYAPFPCTVPWRDFVVPVASEHAFLTNPKRAVQEVLVATESLRDAKARLQNSYRDDVLWTTAASLAANNLLVEAVKTCLPPSIQGRRTAGYAAAHTALAAHKCIKH
jgi:hypothetical protein